MACKYFYDLPIYRNKPDKYEEHKKTKISAQIDDIFAGIQPTEEELKERRDRLGGFFYEEYGPWKFNEIIGYIRLHFLGRQIRGEYFARNVKREKLSRKKVLVWKTHKLAPEITIPLKSSNMEILNLIFEYVDDCREELPKQRFVDDEWLKEVGRYLDWQSLITRKG